MIVRAALSKTQRHPELEYRQDALLCGILRALNRLCVDCGQKEEPVPGDLADDWLDDVLEAVAEEGRAIKSAKEDHDSRGEDYDSRGEDYD